MKGMSFLRNGAVAVAALIAVGAWSPAFADDDHGHDHDHEHGEVSDLSIWEGDWVSAHVYLEEPAGVQMIGDIAGHIGASAEEVQAAFEEMLVTSFTHMSIDGDQVTLRLAGEPVECTYNYHGEVNLWFEGTPYPWYAFATADASCAEQEYLVLGMAHGEGASYHFHLRYGSGDPQAVMDDESLALWYPSFFPTTLTAAKFAAEMSPADSEMAAYIASLLAADDDHGHDHSDDHDQTTPDSPRVGNAGIAADRQAGGGNSRVIMLGAAIVLLSLGSGATVFAFRRR